MTAKEPWHLNRSVPVTLIFAIVLQAAAIVVAGTDMRADIYGNSGAIGRNAAALAGVDSKTDRLAEAIQAQATALARTEESLKNIQAQLSDLKDRRE